LQLTLRLTLVLALASFGVPAQPAPPTPAPDEAGEVLEVTHGAVACMVAGRHPVIEADFTPEAAVRRARVYFHSSLSDAFHYVEMERTGGRFVATLPRPRADAGPVTYFVEGLALDGAPVRTAAFQASVVEAESACAGRLAVELPPMSPVRVFSLDGSTALPAGFDGVGPVVADGLGAAGLTAAAGTAVVPPLAADDSDDRRTRDILLGIAAIGVLAGVLVLESDEQLPPASPSR